MCSHVGTTAWRRCNHNITLLKCAFSPNVKTCGKAENDEAKSGNDEAKGVPGRRGVTEGDGTM